MICDPGCIFVDFKIADHRRSLAASLPDLRSYCFCAFAVTAMDDDQAAFCGKTACGFGAKSGAAAGHQRPLSSQLQIHLVLLPAFLCDQYGPRNMARQREAVAER